MMIFFDAVVVFHILRNELHFTSFLYSLADPMTRNLLAKSIDDLEKLIKPPPPINHSTPIVRLYLASDKLYTEVVGYVLF